MAKLTLEQRVDALEAMEDIKRLKYEYCRICDTGYDPQKIVSLFTPDGVWELGPDDRNVGHAGIAKKFSGMADAIPFASHLVMNPIIYVDGDKAYGKWWILMPGTRKIDGTISGYWFLGTYDDEYARIGDVWKFRRISIDTKFWTHHLEDWAPHTLKKVG